MYVEVTAPIEGKVVQILVKEGDMVSEDQYLLVLDALKMEHPIVAPCEGTVRNIRVKENDKVEADELLLVIE